MDDQLPGSKLAERLMARPDGATMEEIVAATGGPQYNVLKKLEGRGYLVRKVKEGRTTRYFVEPPAEPAFHATMTSKGQVTIPQEIRNRLHLRRGQTVRFSIEGGNRVVIAPVFARLSELDRVLSRPDRRLTVEEMGEAIRTVVAERHRRAVGRMKR